MKNYLLLCSTVLLLSCNNIQNVNLSLKENTVCNTNNECTVDFRKVFKTDFDTMFIFSEFSQLEGIRLITKNKDYYSWNLFTPSGFLVEDSHIKIILIKDKKIVFDQDFDSDFYPSSSFKQQCISVSKVGTFDNESFTHTAILYPSAVYTFKGTE